MKSVKKISGNNLGELLHLFDILRKLQIFNVAVVVFVYVPVFVKSTNAALEFAARCHL